MTAEQTADEQRTDALPGEEEVAAPGLRRWLILAAAIAAVLWPLARSPQQDGFPLSNFPMFTQIKPRQATVDVAFGLDANGVQRILRPRLVGGSVEVIHAASTVSRSISDGSTSELCGEIAARVSEGGPVDVIEIVVVTDRYDTVEAIGGEQIPLERALHARCEVDR